jgi:hypothetical protein
LLSERYCVQPDASDTAALSSGSPTAWDFDLKSTRTMQWSFGVQREVLPQTLLDVTYVGTRTLGLIGNINLNQSLPGPGAQGPRRPYYSVNPDLVTGVRWPG